MAWGQESNCLYFDLREEGAATTEEHSVLHGICSGGEKIENADGVGVSGDLEF